MRLPSGDQIGSEPQPESNVNPVVTPRAKSGRGPRRLHNFPLPVKLSQLALHSALGVPRLRGTTCDIDENIRGGSRKTHV
jgi:hypothetical protein